MKSWNDSKEEAPVQPADSSKTPTQKTKPKKPSKKQKKVNDQGKVSASEGRER